MKKIFATALASTLALSGCMHMMGHHGRYYEPPRAVLPKLETRANPVVTVENGKISVTPEVLIYGKNEGPVTITWRLPEQSNLRFDKERGIVIEGELLDRVIRGNDRVPAVVLNPKQDQITCAPGANEREYKCYGRNSRYMLFKYTMRVYDGDKLLERDPPGIFGADM